MLEMFADLSHRRWNPLRGNWTLVSPHRTRRPWLGHTDEPHKASGVQYDATCYMCPGNVRASGIRTPSYSGTYVFENDYAALVTEAPGIETDEGGLGLMRASTERGICRVICFDPRHDLTLATMGEEAIRRVVAEWIVQESELGARDAIGYVQIFENRRAIMGCSNPHPHGQIWATDHVPNEPQLELAAQREYFEKNGRPLLLDYLRLEVQARERIVAENPGWVALVPFWAVWPFELLLIPREPMNRLSAMGAAEREALAAMLKTVTSGYDRVFHVPFPYSMGFHPAPCDDTPHPEWQLHAHFYPPLLRSASIKKFMVGFELLGSPQRDVTPEIAAATLRKAIDSPAPQRES